jgi:DNA-binding NtrC family response regulator
MNTKILVVDDEPDIRALLKDILEDEGYDVDVAENAHQANQRKSEFSPDLVLLDIWMPEMDGVTLLKQWSENNQLTSPVVMMSGHGTVETAVEATRYGAIDFVEKPLSMAKLLRTVKSVLTTRDENEQHLTDKLEMPVGHSRVMQNLRQTMQALARDLKPVFLSGPPGSGLDIWANYLFSQQASQLPIQTQWETVSGFQQGLMQNVFIAEVTDLTIDRQRLLLTLLQRGVMPASRGRLCLASQYEYDSLCNKSEILPELAEYWRSAIRVPSLNERIEDIPELLEYYVTWFSDQQDLPYRHFGVAAQNLIRNHQWNGGLDELKSVIRQILSNSNDDVVELNEIQRFLMLSHQPQPLDSHNVLHLAVDLELDMREAREFFEKKYLQKQLELCNYNVSELARKVGQERTNLYRKLKQLGLQTRK